MTHAILHGECILNVYIWRDSFIFHASCINCQLNERFPTFISNALLRIMISDVRHMYSTHGQNTLQLFAILHVHAVSYTAVYIYIYIYTYTYINYL